MYRIVTLIRGKWMLKKWCFTFDSMCIQWNDGSEFLLHIIHVVYKIIAISLKSFSKHVYQIDLCSAWENSKDVFNRSMPWLSEFKDAFIEQFTVGFLKARCLQVHYMFEKNPNFGLYADWKVELAQLTSEITTFWCSFAEHIMFTEHFQSESILFW